MQGSEGHSCFVQDAIASAQTQVFDPGIPEIDEDSVLVLDAVIAVVKQQGVRPMSCREG